MPTKLKELLGWTISVDEHGKFHGVRGAGHFEQKMTRTNLRDLEREITKRASGRIELMPATYFVAPPIGQGQHYPRDGKIPSPEGVTKSIVVTVEGGRPRDDRGQLGGHWGRHVLYDQAVVDKAMEFSARREAAIAVIEEEYVAWLRTLDLKPISAEEAMAILAQQSEPLQPMQTVEKGDVL